MDGMELQEHLHPHRPHRRHVIIMITSLRTPIDTRCGPSNKEPSTTSPNHVGSDRAEPPGAAAQSETTPVSGRKTMQFARDHR